MMKGISGVILWISAPAIVLTILIPVSAGAFPGETTRVSVATGGTQSSYYGHSYSSSGSLSADGRFVAFHSIAANLVPGDTNGVIDIFVHDRLTGATTRVSVDSAGVQGNNECESPAMSADGRFVAFNSRASNLVPGDTNGVADIFVHDRLTGTTTRVSVSSTGVQANNHSYKLALSADGRIVAFSSGASNLVPGDTGWEDIFVHDRLTGATTRVSVDSAGAQGNGSSQAPALSADGWFVTFFSSASNLVPGDNNARDDIFVHDRLTGATTRVSVDSAGTQGNDNSRGTWRGPVVSADGRFVAFESGASNLVPGDTNGVNDIFVHDRTTGATVRVSVDSAGTQGNSSSYGPALSADGRFVAFSSTASNLVPGDTAYEDIFVHDRLTGATTPVSVSSAGAKGNYGSSAPALSPDARFVAFWSSATNLVPADTNAANDVFVHAYETAWYRGEFFNADFEGDTPFAPPLNFPTGLPTFDSAMTQSLGFGHIQVLPGSDNTGFITQHLDIYSGMDPGGTNQLYYAYTDNLAGLLNSGVYTLSWRSAVGWTLPPNTVALVGLADLADRGGAGVQYQWTGRLTLNIGSGVVDIGAYTPIVPQTFSLVVNMDSKTLDAYVDGSSVVTAGPLLNAAFAEIRKLYFRAADPGGFGDVSLRVDDIRIAPGGDADGDGAADSADNCPSTYNPDQWDTDGDGFGDLCDICPTMHDPLQTDTDGDYIGDACDTDADNDGVADKDAVDSDSDSDPDSFGLLTIVMGGDACPTIFNLAPQNDFDGDRISDACDNCPAVANADQIDSDGDGRGDACEGVVVPETEKPSANSTPPPDTDGDGIADTSDNCPAMANADQNDSDGDSIGDACDVCGADAQNDADGDGICAGTGFASPKIGDTDNCPVVSNASQADLDADGAGDACDGDADGDTYLAIASGGMDCNDRDALVSPGNAESPGNNKDDDCNPATPDSSYAIVFAGADYDTWLPAAGGAPVSLTATVVGPGGSLPDPVTFTLSNVTHYPGAYTNDDSTNTDADIAWSYLGNTLTFTPLDYGGSITIHAEATVSGVSVSADFTLPKDSDADGLPDAWEHQYGDLDPSGDIDAGAGNPYKGDGLTNFEEYRGFVWKQLEDVSSDPRYKTPAFAPAANAAHFRTNPRRKDLFVAFAGYDAAEPFAIGAAFWNAGIDVHAMEASLVGTCGETNIDMLKVTDERVNPYPFTDGHINKRGIRDWSWDTKGSTDRLGDAATYGSSTTYMKSLEGYFGDRPYQDRSPLVNGRLDPISVVEDLNDNGTDDRLKGSSESGTDGFLAGDLVVIGNYAQELTSFDVDANGLMELPVAGSPDNIDRTHEYTRAQVLKHTITHEMGHAVGMPHNSDATCLMYEYTNDWSRDAAFKATATGQGQIHNN